MADYRVKAKTKEDPWDRGLMCHIEESGTEVTHTPFQDSAMLRPANNLGKTGQDKLQPDEFQRTNSFMKVTFTVRLSVNCQLDD